MKIPWIMFDEPVELGDLNNYRYVDGKRQPRGPQVPERVGIQILMNDGDIWLVGDCAFYHITVEAGCGCCADKCYDETAVGWRDIGPYLEALDD